MASLFRVPLARRLLLALADGATAAAALSLALYLHFEELPEPMRPGPHPTWLLLLAAARVASAVALGTDRWSFRFSGLTDGLRVGLAAISGTIGFIATLALAGTPLPPKGAVVSETLLSLGVMLALRFAPRLVWIHRLQRDRSRNGVNERAFIVGAGAAGELLLRDLARSRDHSYLVQGFVDDDSRKHGTVVAGRPVLGSLSSIPELVRRHRVDLVLIAIPRIPAPVLRGLLSTCSSLQVRFKSLPLSHASAHRSGIAQLKSLAPEDLLPRAEVRFSASSRARKVAGRSALITGAAGSIGSELARQMLEAGARRLMLVDQDENGLYLLHRALADRFPGQEVEAEVANVRDPERLTGIAIRFGPQDLLHAAAHKQVPMIEGAPAEAVKTNICGTRNAVAAAVAARVERFLLISTDKAIRPTSVMGASKRVAEMIVRRSAGAIERPCVVRFGNVLGSAGSVVPLFQRQIEERRPVTVTHPEVERYFMTVSEAVGLVLAAMYDDYGEICTLVMGEPMRVLDLARHMITMAGLVPDVDIPIVFTGLRPGEKMSEDLIDADEEHRRREDGIRVTAGGPLPVDLDFQVQRLADAAAAGEPVRIRKLLSGLVPGFAADDDGLTAAGEPPALGRRGERESAAESA